MIRTTAILPVKEFASAKSRLSSVLTGAQCASLARLMAIDVLRALSNTPEIDRVLLLGQGDEQAALAARFGCDYAIDDPVLDMSANLSRIACSTEIQSATNLLVVPADLPRLRPADISRVLHSHREGVTVCRAVRDGGTNAFIATMPQQIVFCFGVDSANRHILAARDAGLPVSLLDDGAFERDIDTPEDLLWLCYQKNSCDTASFLQELKLATESHANTEFLATA